MESFNSVLADLRKRLSTGAIIKNWSVLKGYTGRDFRVVAVDPAAITVAGGTMRASSAYERFEDPHGGSGEEWIRNFPPRPCQRPTLASVPVAGTTHYDDLERTTTFRHLQHLA
jgi:hypothetical protein